MYIPKKFLVVVFILAASAAIGILSFSRVVSGQNFTDAETACMNFIPNLEGLTGAEIYDRRTVRGKLVIDVSGKSRRLGSNRIVTCVYDPEKRRSFRPSALDNSWN
jgi:hypothetical protein